MATTARHLRLLSLLQTRRHWSGEELAGRLGISNRTVRRDVDRLREMGYRIDAVKGPDGGYQLEAGSELPPLLFDDEQVVALAVALRAAPTLGAGIGEVANRALASVRHVMPTRLAHRLDAIEFSMTERAGAATAEQVDPDVLADLGDAVRSQHIVRFGYQRTDQVGATDTADSPAIRRVEAHHVVASGRRWYLVGWDLDREDWRIFRVDRMELLPTAGHRFWPRALPAKSAAAFVSARFKGSIVVDRWPCVGRVRVHLPAHEVEPFAGDATVEARNDGSCVVEAGSWSWVALAASFARFDADVDVLEPPELADAFGLLAQRFSRLGAL